MDEMALVVKKFKQETERNNQDFDKEVNKNLKECEALLQELLAL
jgi:hypothetical protein